MKRQLKKVAFLVLFLIGASEAIAQVPTDFAIEGHVFNAKNGQPLPGVVVNYSATLPNGDGVGVATPTDDNGFYYIEYGLPPDGVTVEFFAVCRTKKRGDIRYDTRFYSVIRPEVYRRDFYITLPKGVSTCAVDTPG